MSEENDDWQRRKKAIVEFALARFVNEAEARFADVSRTHRVGARPTDAEAADAFWRDAADGRRALAEIREEKHRERT